MCGIVGANCNILNPSEVLKTIQHRGMDFQSFTCNTKRYLAHARLSIIDLNDEANQPMVYEGISLVFNGEIYNYKSLITKYHLQCVTASDSEVLIRMYQKFGTKFVDKLEGMFSFCIYDEEKDSFFCARDRFGKKPFYYYQEENHFYFASEIKAIIKMLGYTPKMNTEALWQYLAYQSPQSKNTFYTGIFKLPAGHTLEYTAHQLHVQPYYSLNTIALHHDTRDNIITKVDTLLHQSIEKRLVGDVEVATLLSGGLDSSLISALYTKKSDKPIHTFSIGYDEYTHYSELSYAKYAANILHSVHHEYSIDKKTYLDTIDKVLEHLDEPMADSASIPTYLLSKEIHNYGIKVCLSGEGSDEIFLGYDKYFDILKYYNSKVIKNEDFNLSREWEYNNRKLHNEPIYQSSGETFSYEQLLRLSNQAIPYPLHPYSSKYKPTQWLTYIDFSIWISEVLMTKVDRMSMAHSLELRAPFLDYSIVEYMMGVESTIKIGNTNKNILKSVARNYLPNEIVDRQKKGFSSPFIEWIYDGFGDEILHLFLDVNAHSELFNEAFLHFLYNEGKSGRFKQHIYSLYIFCKWYKKVYM